MTTLPNRTNFKTPRLLLADAYTIGADLFQSDKAKEKSVYYITFRRRLHAIDPSLYDEDDDRTVFLGLQSILEELFYEPVTMEEIEETEKFLSTFKATTTGLKPYWFNKDMWVKIVNEYNGRPPIKIEAMPEGSVVYPNEPNMIITSLVDGWGELAAYFESKLLHTWATSERATANRHWFKYLCEMITDVDPGLPMTAGPGEPSVTFFASILCHDFGDRAGICGRESEVLGKTHLYSFGGTDTVAGAYQAWKAAGETPGVATSVYALAHRNVQGWDHEKDCYRALFDRAEEGDFLSNVADCYDFENAVSEYLLPLALESAEFALGKVIVARPDSGDAMKQVLFVLNTAVANGLYTESNGYKYPTTLKAIEGDAMTWVQMRAIFDKVKELGFAPHAWVVFCVGGGLRNTIKRDNLSAKYALCARGNDNDGVIKIAIEGKETLPGPMMVRRDSESLEKRETIAHVDEPGETALVEFFNGARLEKPFGVGMDDDFWVIKARIQADFDVMPKNLRRPKTDFPATNRVMNKKRELVAKHGL